MATLINLLRQFQCIILGLEAFACTPADSGDYRIRHAIAPSFYQDEWTSVTNVKEKQWLEKEKTIKHTNNNKHSILSETYDDKEDLHKSTRDESV